MKCKNCGFECTEGADFCIQCGKPLDALDFEKTQNVRKHIHDTKALDITQVADKNNNLFNGQANEYDLNNNQKRNSKDYGDQYKYDTPKNKNVQKNNQTIIIAISILIALLIIVSAGTFIFINIYDNNSASSVKSSDTSTTTDEIIMPDVEGIKIEDAKKELRNAGINYEIVYEQSNEVNKGFVIRQSEIKGTRLTDQDTVTIYVAEESQKANATSDVNEYLYCCASDYATLRETNSRNGKELAKIKSREAVKWLSTYDEFYYVEYLGKKGYVLKDFFSTNSSAPLNYSSGDIDDNSTQILYCRASEYATLRKSPSRSSDEIKKIYCRDSVKYISSSGEFYYVEYSGKKGYVLKDFFSTNPSAPLNYGTGNIDEDSTETLYCRASEYATLRKSPSKSSDEIKKIYCRDSVKFISSSGEFYYVKYQDKYGYVLKDYFSSDKNAPLNYGLS